MLGILTIIKNIGKHRMKMQEVKFQNLEEFFEYLPKNELEIVFALREFVLSIIPYCKETLSYNVPYFKVNSTICFIWPSSVKWGNSKNTGVRFGFGKGYLMKDEYNIFDKGNRKQIFWIDFHNLEEIDFEILEQYMKEAVEIDKAQAKKKKKGNL